MRIERIRVDRYGPLRVDLEVDGGVHLVRGPNESGKSLLVEAVLEMLGGSPVGERVGESAAGFLVVSDVDGETRLDADRCLVDHVAETRGYGLTGAEIRNVFVTRDADLRIRDSSFYESVTERITGLRTSEIRALQEAVRDRGLLTPSLRLINDRPHNKPKRQKELAEELGEAVREYVAEARADDVDSLERRRFEATRRRRSLAARIEELRTAEKRAEIGALQGAVDRLREAVAERESLPAEEAMDRLRRRLDGLEPLPDDDELHGRRRTWRRLALAGWAVTAAVFLGFGLLDLPAAATAAAVLSLLLAGVSTYRWHAASRRIADAGRERSTILADASDAGLAVESIEDLRRRLGAVERDRGAARRAIDRAVGELRPLDLDADDPEALIEDAEAALAERRESLPEVAVEYSETRLAEAEAELEAAEAEIAELEAKLEDHERALRRFADRAGRIEFEYFAGEPLDLQVANLEALELLAERLQALVAEIEATAEVARQTHDVLESMEGSEGEKVERLFGESSRAASLFERVTDDAYESVRYDSEGETLVVRHGRHGDLHPGALSRGTRSQLYFCVRVALAEQILDGGPGFFLLDEAFLPSDGDRLDRQAALLDELAADGWQVVYLTAKADAAAALEGVCTGTSELEPL